MLSCSISVTNVSLFNSVLLPPCMERVKSKQTVKRLLKDQTGNVKQ